MAKTDKQVIIDFIVSCLEKGESRGKVLSKVVKKWQMSDRTFDRHLKTASEQHKARQEAIKKELAAIDTQAAIDARKKAIMTAEERKEYLTKIAKGELKIKRPFVIGGKIMEYLSEPDATERMKAINELNKMDGGHAPTKVAATDKAGNDVRQTFIINGKEIEF